MALRVVGAGLGRTGTHSLKIALTRLLGAPCYHMEEVFANEGHVRAWHDAALGKPVDWQALFAGYAASVDWPACAYWPELMQAFPDSLVLLSVRDPNAWWESASATIFDTRHHDHPLVTPEWKQMIQAMFAHRWSGSRSDREAAIAAFRENTARALREVPPERLLVWQASEGWEPLCKALGVAVPDEAFPHSNARAEWRKDYRGNDSP